MKKLLDKAKFWNHSHELSARHDELWDKYVPVSGNTEFVEAEALRAAARLYYDFYNNGWCSDMRQAIKFLRGYFFLNKEQIKNLDECSRVITILLDEQEMSEEEYNDRIDSLYEIFDDEAVIDALESIVEAVVKKLIAAEDSKTLTKADADFWEC